MPRLRPDQRRQVGTMRHECGSTALVFQSTRTHLYLLCPLCGKDQRNAAAIQTDWWARLEKTPGLDIKKPWNVIDQPEKIREPVPDNPEKTEALAGPVGVLEVKPEKPRQAQAPQGLDGILEVKKTPEKLPIGEPNQAPQKTGNGGVFLLAMLALGSGLSLIINAMAGNARVTA